MQDNHTWLRYLESLHPKTIDLTLERVKQVGKSAGLFHFDAKVILVAGTNGKGTTVCALNKLLRKANLSVACYTSPHVLEFNERISINDQCVSDAVLINAFEVIEKLRGDISLTYFEFTTLAAFYIFKQQPLDVLIIEVGLGGRLDAVNCLSPDLSLITTIAYDHQSWLGCDLDSIAKEKAGIFRENKPCIIGKSALIPSLVEHAKHLKCEIYADGRDFDWGLENNEMHWHFKNQHLSVPQHNLPNNSVSIALCAYKVLGTMLALPDLNAVINSLERVSLLGRFYTVMQMPEMIVDVAHNEESCQLLKSRILAYDKPGKRFAVWAMLNDKEVDKVSDMFKDVFDAWYIPKLNSSRAFPQKMLVESLSSCGVNKIFCVDSTKLAYEMLIQEMKVQDQVIVFGSFFTVSEWLEAHKSK